MKEKRLNRESGGFLELESELAREGNRFFRFAYRLCGSREDAEDIVVAAFVAACQNHHRLRDTEASIQWLYRIVLNQWRMHRRRHSLPSLPLTEMDETGVQFSTDHIALAQAMERLSPKQREALVLVKGEGLTLKEAAGLLRRPVGTVASHVTQALGLLRKELYPSADAEVGREVRLKHELP